MLEEIVTKLNAKATGGNWYSALCPFHSDRNSSLAFNSDHFVCFSCGKTGPLADLLGVDVLVAVANTPESDRQEKLRTLRTAKLQSMVASLWNAPAD